MNRLDLFEMIDFIRTPESCNALIQQIAEYESKVEDGYYEIFDEKNMCVVYQPGVGFSDIMEVENAVSQYEVEIENEQCLIIPLLNGLCIDYMNTTSAIARATWFLSECIFMTPEMVDFRIFLREKLYEEETNGCTLFDWCKDRLRQTVLDNIKDRDEITLSNFDFKQFIDQYGTERMNEKDIDVAQKLVEWGLYSLIAQIQELSSIGQNGAGVLDLEEKEFEVKSEVLWSVNVVKK